MNGIDRSPAVSQTAFFARLESTVPAAAMNSNHQIQPLQSDFLTAQKPKRKAQNNWFISAVDTFVQHRLWIAGLTAAGGLLSVLYTQQMCVPLYRVQASLALQTQTTTYRVEALARVLVSQSLVGTALDSLSAAERNQLIEPRGWASLSPLDITERLRERLDSNAVTSAQVIDVSLLSPNRSAAVTFVNSLLMGLMRRDPSEGISVIDPAIASAAPVSPNALGNLIVGLLCGAVSGIAYALLRKFAGTTFAGPGSVGNVLGVRELGAMADRKLLAAPGEEVAATAMDFNDEALRYLRSSLLYQPGKQQIRCLAFTSAAPGEGKTTIVSQLSMSLAATGRRVLAIDGDLRRPRLHRLLQVPAGPGLADLLRRVPSARPAALSRYVLPTSFQNLYVMPPGTAGNDAPELLAGQNLQQLIHELARSFDFILIDTPPLLACADARNFSRAVEGVVLVVRSSETQKRAVMVARDMMLADGANIIGTVLTGWRQSYPAYNYPAPANYLTP